MNTQERLYISLLAALALNVAPKKFNKAQREEIILAGRSALSAHESEKN